LQTIKWTKLYTGRFWIYDQKPLREWHCCASKCYLENKIIYQSNTTFFIMLLHSHRRHVSTHFLSHPQALFLRYRSLLPTLKMHCGIPNAYNFAIMTLYRCMLHQFCYLDRVHTLYIFKISTTEATLYLYF
jgi:hypothetical protein